MLEPEFAERVAEAAHKAAMDFFQPSPEWEIYLRQEELDECEAQCRAKHDYFVCNIIYDPAAHEDGAHLWKNMGHEVAHLLLSELWVFELQVPQRYEAQVSHATERAVTRLHRLFERERPYPGDEVFQT